MVIAPNILVVFGEVVDIFDLTGSEHVVRNVFPPAFAVRLDVESRIARRTCRLAIARDGRGNAVTLPLDSPLAEIVIRVGDAGSPAEVAAVADGLLRRLHGGANDYEVIVPEALLEQSRQTQRLFDIVMGSIASISLLVGGIGIMNIMLASVLEQTRAIGIRRAVGARQRDIRFQFLVTSFALSALGGIAGVMLGVVLAHLVAAYADWPTVVTASSVLLSTDVSISVGLVSGLYPAIRAARLDPIEALRYE